MNGKFCGYEQRQKYKHSVLVAVHVGDGCALAVHQSAKSRHLHIHLYLIGQMLACFHRYDHANYARCVGTICLAHMNDLPVQVLAVSAGKLGCK